MLIVGGCEAALDWMGREGLEPSRPFGQGILNPNSASFGSTSYFMHL